MFSRTYQFLEDLWFKVFPKPQKSERKVDVKNRKNYASRESGATIIFKDDGIRNPKAILSANKEEYLIIPKCTED